MSINTTTVTAEVTETLLKKYDKHKKDITGLIEVGGSFNGGEVFFFISLSDGTVINPWLYETGEHFKTEVPTTREFNIPILTQVTGGFVSLYYTFQGSNNPNLTITIGDNA